MRSYDVVVIGAGPAGYEAALELGRGGKSVLLIDRAKERIGGVCLNEGCIPAKTYLESAEYSHKAELFRERGLNVSVGELELDVLRGQKDLLVDEIRSGVVWLLDQAKVELAYGTAKFADAKTIDLDGELIGFEQCIIAVGSKVREVETLPFDGKKIISSTEVFTMDALPKSIAIVGGGPIGCEMASFFNGFGVEVTLTGRREYLVPGEDEDVSKALMREFKKRGMTLLTGATVAGAEVTDSGVTLTLGNEQVTCEMVLVAAGRVPNSDGLEADKAGVSLDGKGYVEVDGAFRTANSNIYAIGDCIPTPGYAHTAYAEAKVAAHNILTGESAENRRLTPSAIFAHPNVGSCGLNESQARAQGLEVEVKKAYFKASARAKIHGNDGGFAKVVVDAKSGKVLGAAIVGVGATETIHELLIAVEQGMSLEALKNLIYVHPSLAEIVTLL